jgi:hypothetical protein
MRSFRLLAITAVLVALAPTALAAGTGGIEVTPLPGIVDGQQVTAFHTTLPSSGTASVEFALRNITSEPRKARVYAASARADGQGGFTIGDAGSSPYIELDDRTVSLAKEETRVETFEVRAPSGKRPDETVHAAVVIEVQRGSVVQRAATMVYLEPGERAPLPRWAAVVAVTVLVAVTLALLLVVRRRRRTTE